MTVVLNLLLRLTIWFLLTADSSFENIIFGFCVAILIPQGSLKPAALKDWCKMLWKIMIAIPQAYYEAIEMMLRPHTQEEIVVERGEYRQSPGLIFLDIFLITFTPKTIVVKYHDDGACEVHHVKRRQFKRRKIA